MFDIRTPRGELGTAELLEKLIGSARIGPATPSSPDLLARARQIVGEFLTVPEAEGLRALRSPRA